MVKTKKQIAQENMAKAIGLDELYKSENFQLYFLPYLKELSYTEKIRPDKYSGRDEYLYNLEIASIRAQVYEELLKFFQGQEHYIKKMKEVIAAPDKSYTIGDALQTIEKATTSTG